jgi:hypothetical protein
MSRRGLVIVAEDVEPDARTGTSRRLDTGTGTGRALPRVGPHQAMAHAGIDARIT